MCWTAGGTWSCVRQRAVLGGIHWVAFIQAIEITVKAIIAAVFFVSAGCMFATCTVLMWAFVEMRSLFRAVSAWQLGPRVERASRRNVQVRNLKVSSPRFFIRSMTYNQIAPAIVNAVMMMTFWRSDIGVAQANSIVFSPLSLNIIHGLCVAGDTCYFGNGWCSRTIPAFAKSRNTMRPAWN